MNVCMIMCHKNAKQVIRLATRCITQNTDVIIHADCDMNNKEYKHIEEYVKNAGGVYLAHRRFHGVLDTRSLVDIVLEMIRCAKVVEQEKAKRYQYYFLLSGQDYLIKPMRWIESQLDSLYPKPLIDCTPYSDTNWIYYKFRNGSTSLRINKFIGKRLKDRPFLRKPFRLTELVLQRFEEMSKRNTYARLDREQVRLFGGSAWWVLPDIVINYIIQEYNGNKEYIHFMLDESQTPEETFFQILTMRSPVSNLVEVNPIEMVAQNCKTWAYFSDDGKPFKGHPYIFTTQEFDKLCASECWFARKFDETVDNEIFDLIDQKLLGV